MTIRRLPGLLAVASILLLAACTGGGATRSPATPAPSPGIDGRTFLSTGVTGASLVAGSQVRIAFADGRIAVSAGCNSMSGSYSLDGDTLRTGSMATTEMACAEPLMAQDQWVGALLDGATVRLVGDRLTITKGGVALVLQDRRTADPDRPLEGTRWVVVGLVSGGAVSSVPGGVTATLTFANGRVEVRAGCNSGGGTVTVTDTTIAFGAIGLTKMACAQPATAVEAAVTAVLARDVSYTIEAGTLTLEAGDLGLILRADA